MISGMLLNSAVLWCSRTGVRCPDLASVKQDQQLLSDWPLIHTISWLYFYYWLCSSSCGYVRFVWACAYMCMRVCFCLQLVRTLTCAEGVWSGLLWIVSLCGDDRACRQFPAAMRLLRLQVHLQHQHIHYTTQSPRVGRCGTAALMATYIWTAHFFILDYKLYRRNRKLKTWTCAVKGHVCKVTQILPPPDSLCSYVFVILDRF